MLDSCSLAVLLRSSVRGGLALVCLEVVACESRSQLNRATAGDSSAAPITTASSTPSATVSSTPVATASALPGSPLSRLSPPVRSGPRSRSPLVLEPGVSFGPIALGETLADLKRGGLTVRQFEQPGKKLPEIFAEVSVQSVAGAKPTTFQLRLCDGKIAMISIEDLSEAADRVVLNGKPVDRAAPCEDIARRLGDCSTPDPSRDTERVCAGGGVFLGYGLGRFVRVFPRGVDLTDTCEAATDDGSQVPLAEAVRAKMLEQMLLDRSLSPYWHVDRPGRDPLRIVRTPLVPATPLTMFGSPVVWIDASEARTGTAYLTISRLEANKTRATLAFAYPIEGVAGTIRYRRSFSGDWTVTQGEVHEQR